jgi:C-terminal processing protease CtpA/Prc
MPTWLSDTTLVFVSDRDGQNDLYLIKSADKNESNLFKSLKHETIHIVNTPNIEEFDPVVSPDGNQIIFRRGNGKLIAAGIKPSGEFKNERILLDGWDTPGSVAWSPDSRWIAYQLSDLNFNSEIYILNVDGESDPANVSMHPRYDFNPFWSADGSKLGFVSQRNNNNFDVWFAWLKKTDWEKTQRDWEESEDESSSKMKDSTKTKPIEIDLENIYQRLSQVTSLPGDENRAAISNDGKTFYFTAQSTTGKGTDLFSIKWDGKEVKEITSGGINPSQLKMDKDGSHLYFMKNGGTLARVDTKTGKDENLPFSGEMVIDHQKEKNQIFDEAWRALNKGFYDPDFHGHDWNALKKKYKPWAMAGSTQKDFRDIFNELLGQLNASHMGLRNVQERSETQKEKTGLIGTVVEPLDKGVEVTHVVKDSPADRVQSKLNVGDIILSVNGKNITSKDNFYSYLVNTENDKVLLNVKNKKGETRDVVIRPTSSLRNELYNEWVDQRSKLTDKYSNGRLGYMHIRGMNWPSFERFEREFTARGQGKDGIVIDVRFNGGGWTTDYLMLVLNYKQHAYTIPRGAADNLAEDHTKFRNYYPIGERLPYSAWLKPSIAMCNQNSYSNAEIFSHAYKNLGIGKLVGVPTFGAVISTGGHGLIDGSYVRMPFRGWYVKATDKNMDFSPAVPDIMVENAPDSKSKGEDPQLKRAVEELMKELNNN